MWFPRQREYRADAGGAALVGKKMISALQEPPSASQGSSLDGQLTAIGILGKTAKSEPFMSHPPLEK